MKMRWRLVTVTKQPTGDSKGSAERRRLQFAQVITLISAVFSMVVVVAALAANFALLWNDRQPMAQETITTITVYGGITSTLSFAGYCALTGVRDCSLNKHGLTRPNDTGSSDMGEEQGNG